MGQVRAHRRKGKIVKAHTRKQRLRKASKRGSVSAYIARQSGILNRLQKRGTKHALARIDRIRSSKKNKKVWSTLRKKMRKGNSQ